MSRYARISIFGALFALCLQPVASATGYPRTDADFARLPPVCQVRLQGRAAPSLHDTWKQRVGNANWDYIRNYCAALHIEGQVPRMRDKRARDNAWRQMIAEFEQVEKGAQAGFVLMPEILVRKGKALERLGQPDSAMESYRKAVELNPDYSWSYMAIADLFVAAEQPEEARKILEVGLTKVPERFAKGLQRQLDELGETPAAD